MQSIKNYLLFMITVGHMLFFAACDEEDQPAPQNDQAEAKITLAENPSLGKILIDQDGRTLYFFTKDINGTSDCLEGCISSWPVFHQENIQTGAGLDAADFGTITREDGTKQTTYKGWPLYYYASDTQSGDTNGEGIGEVWFVAKPDYTVMLADQKIDAFADLTTKYITDAQGRTLYYFLQDENNISNCNGGCLDAWPAFVNAEDLIIPSTLDRSTFSVIEREDGIQQLAYKGRAMYFYLQDSKRGETKGQLVSQWTVSRLNWQ